MSEHELDRMVKELVKLGDVLEARIDALEKRLVDVETRLEALGKDVWRLDTRTLGLVKL